MTTVGPRPAARERRAPSAAAAESGPLRGLVRRPGTLGRVGRRLAPHLPFVALLGAGAVLRWMTWRAYRPALLFPDSRSYLLDTAAGRPLDPIRPGGYSLFLRAVLPLGGLNAVSFAQHLIGLALAVAIYLLLLRRGVRRWLAALATAPVLLDSLQLVNEQYVLSDVLFEATLVAGCLLLLWRRRPGPWAVAAAGMALGAGAVIRSAGTLLVVPVVITVLALAWGSWRRMVALVAALVLGFAAPVVAYASVYDAQHGQFALSSDTYRFLYARLAPIADCGRLRLPAAERPLCPSPALQRRLSSNGFMWNTALSPQYTVPTPLGTSMSTLLAGFDRAVVEQEPLRYSRLVLDDVARAFAPFRTPQAAGTSTAPWLLRSRLPQNSVPDQAALYRRFAGFGPVLDDSLATDLAAYQHVGHVPGPLLAAGALVALVAAAGLGRASRSGLRVAAWTFVSLCLVTVLTAAATATFVWRYELPQLALLPPAAALALTALVGRPASRSGTRPAAAGRVPAA